MLQKTIIILTAAALILAGALFLTKASPTAPPMSACSEVLAQDVIPMPLTCGEDIGGDVQLVLTISEDGELAVTRGDTIVFANPDAEDSMRFYTSPEGAELLTDSFKFEDVTYDGYKDIAFLYSAGAYNWTYQYYAFDVAAGTYASKPILEVTNPSVDREARTITTFAKGRGLGDMYVAETFAFENGAYILVRRESQDTISPDADTSQGYVRVLEELKDGQLKETRRETLSEKDVWGEDAPSAQ